MTTSKLIVGLMLALAACGGKKDEGGGGGGGGGENKVRGACDFRETQKRCTEYWGKNWSEKAIADQCTGMKGKPIAACPRDGLFAPICVMFPDKASESREYFYASKELAEAFCNNPDYKKLPL